MANCDRGKAKGPQHSGSGQVEWREVGCFACLLVAHTYISGEAIYDWDFFFSRGSHTGVGRKYAARRVLGERGNMSKCMVGDGV